MDNQVRPSSLRWPRPERLRLPRRVLALLFACAAAPAHAEVVPLAALEQAALSERPTLTAGAARVRAAQAVVGQAKAARKPRFTLRADATFGPGRRLVDLGDLSNTEDSPYAGYLVQASPPFGEQGAAFLPQFQGGLQLSAEARLYDFGRTSASIEAGQRATAAARSALEVNEQEVRSAVRASYLQWLLQHQLAALSEQALEQVVRERERVETLVQRGVRPEGDLTAAETERVLAQLETERARDDLARARSELARAVGSELDPQAEPDLGLLDAPPQAEQLGDATEQMLDRRYRAAKARAEAEARANRPDLSASVTAGARAQLDLDDESRSRNDLRGFPLYGAGMALTVPLWDGGLTREKQAEALAQAQVQRAELEAYRKARRSEEQERAQRAQRGEAQIELAERLVALSKQRLAELGRGYELGATSMQQLVEARSLLRRAQAELIAVRVAQSALRLPP